MKKLSRRAVLTILSVAITSAAAVGFCCWYGGWMAKHPLAVSGQCTNGARFLDPHVDAELRALDIVDSDVRINSRVADIIRADSIFQKVGLIDLSSTRIASIRMRDRDGVEFYYQASLRITPSDLINAERGPSRIYVYVSEHASNPKNMVIHEFATTTYKPPKRGQNDHSGDVLEKLPRNKRFPCFSNLQPFSPLFERY